MSKGHGLKEILELGIREQKQKEGGGKGKEGREEGGEGEREEGEEVQ
jgi:hypothetical protein